MLHYQPPSDREPVIVAALRTPIGRAFSVFESLTAVELVVPVIQALTTSLEDKTCIDDVILGNVVGHSGNIARLAALSAGLPMSVPGVSIDRQCGAGLEAIIQAARNIQAGAGECYIAGGVESVSTEPYVLHKSLKKGGYPRVAHRARFSPDHIGDPDVGVAAENIARAHNISRERQDAFALTSHHKAVAAAACGDFDAEIVPLVTNSAVVRTDECPRIDTSMQALAALQPVFAEQGTVTAGNACPTNDGAAAVLIMSKGLARRCGYRHGLRFLDSASAGCDPNYLGMGPVYSTQKLLSRQPSITLSSVDVVEFNEAFSVQVLACLDALGIDEQRVNRGGGALALGHPYAASGALLVTRLFSQLCRSEMHQHRYAMAMLGIAGGMGLTALFDSVEW